MTWPACSKLLLLSDLAQFGRCQMFQRGAGAREKALPSGAKRKAARRFF